MVCWAGASLLVCALACRSSNTHDGEGSNLFRAIPLPSPPPRAGSLSSLAFELQYFVASEDGDCPEEASEGECSSAAGWRPLRWEQLVTSHTQKLHAYILSQDGRDFYHLHGRAHDNESTRVEVEVALGSGGSHLVVVSWVVDADQLGICVVEGVAHAHSTRGGGVYPLLMDQSSFTASPSVDDEGRGTHSSPQLHSSRSIACPVAGQKDADGEEAGEGVWHFSGPYPLTNGHHAGCTRIDLAWRSIEARTPEVDPRAPLPYLLPFPFESARRLR